MPPESHFKIALLTDEEARGSFSRAVEIVSAAHNGYQWGFPYDWSAYLGCNDGGYSPASFFTWIVWQYGRSTGGVAEPATWIDHTPVNALYGQLLLEAFSNGRLIHLVRNPKAVFASVKPLDWGPNTAYLGALEWLHYVTTAYVVETWYPERVARVRYEEFLSDFGDVPNALLKEAGFDAASKPEGWTTPDYVGAGFQHPLVGGQPNLQRIDAWRSSLAEAEVTLIDSITCNFQQVVGYVPDQVHGTVPTSVAPSLAIELLKRTGNKLRFKINRFRETVRLRNRRGKTRGADTR